MSNLILQKWYVLDIPWGDGTSILAGNPDPHGGLIVCDNEHAIFNPEVYETDDIKQLIRNIMSHVVSIHNAWLANRR